MGAEISNEVSLLVPAMTDPAPAQIASVGRTSGTVHLVVQLPAVSEDGQPLAALSGLKVFADTDTLLGKIEKLLGMDAILTVPLDAAKAGQQITVDIPGLPAGHWHFRVQPV